MQNLDLEKLLMAYQEEVKQDLKVDELSLKDKTMLVPTIKHKWVGRLMVHKLQLRKLEEAKKKAVRDIVDKSPVSLSKTSVNNIVGGNGEISTIQDNIDKLEVIIEYLEKVEKMTGSLTWDCKNLIDLQKLETT